MFSVDDLGMLLSQPAPRSVPEAVRSQMLKPALALGCGCGGCLSLVFFPFSLVIPILVYVQYQKNLELIEKGRFCMAFVRRVSSDTSTIVLEVEGGEVLQFTPWFKRKEQLALARRAHNGNEQVGVLYRPESRGAALLAEVLVETA